MENLKRFKQYIGWLIYTLKLKNCHFEPPIKWTKWPNETLIHIFHFNMGLNCPTEVETQFPKKFPNTPLRDHCVSLDCIGACLLEFQNSPSDSRFWSAKCSQLFKLNMCWGTDDWICTSLLSCLYRWRHPPVCCTNLSDEHKSNPDCTPWLAKWIRSSLRYDALLSNSIQSKSLFLMPKCHSSHSGLLLP